MEVSELKFKDFYKKKKTIIPIVIIIIAMFAAVSAWQYKNYLDNRWSGIDFERGFEEFEEPEEKQEIQEGGISIIEEEEKEEEEELESIKESEEEIKEVIVEEEIKANIATTSGNVSSIPAIKMEEPKMETMLTPVFGTVCMDFSNGELLYSKTLDLWTIHEGIDIKAEEGSQVRAAMDGTISEILNDPQWGYTIAIDHGSGISTRYSNLSTLDMITLGQKVKKGDVISGIGKTAICEIAEDPHLHFEVVKDGKNLDPKIYLPKQSLNR